MKIAYLTDQFLPRTSADTEQFVTMVSALSLRPDVSIDLVAPKYSYKAPNSVDDLNEYYQTSGVFELKHISLLIPFIRGFEKIWYALKAAFFIDRKETDIVYTRNIPVVMAIILFTEIPVLFETYRPWPDRNFMARTLFKWLQKKTKFAGIVLHSKFAAQSYLNNGFTEERLMVAHNAINLPELQSENLPKAELRKRLELPADQKIVTYSGRVSPEKGLQRMLNLAGHFPEVLFVIVGSEQKGPIEQEAEKFSNVKVIGWQDKKTVFQYLRASDVLYIPTSTRARDQAGNTVLPLKTFIYKASGTAILAPDMADIREVLTDRASAILVKPDDENDEIEGLKLLLEDTELRERIGNQALQEIKENTWESRAERILNFISKRLKSD